MDTSKQANALEFLVDRVRQLEAQMAFVSMTVALLGNANPEADPVRASASEILGIRAAEADVRKFLARHALYRPKLDRDSL